MAAPAFVKPQEPPLGAQKYLQHALYGMLICNAAAYAWGYLWKFEEGLSLAISILMAEVFFSVMLLWRPARFGVTGPMKVLIGVIAVLVVLDAISGISQGSYMIYLAAEQGRLNAKPPVFWDLPWIMLLGKISITWRLLAGITGLAALWMNREVESSQPQP